MQDRLSSRYSLSGGYIDRGRLRSRRPCASCSRRPASRGQSRHRRAGALATGQGVRLPDPGAPAGPAGTGFVSLLQAPDLGGEILNARLIAADDLPPDQRRFPAQLDWIAPRLAEVPESQVLWVTDFSDAASALHRAELPLIQRLQRWLGAGCALAKGGQSAGLGPLPAGAAALAAAPARLVQAAPPAVCHGAAHPGGEPAQGGHRLAQALPPATRAGPPECPGLRHAERPRRLDPALLGPAAWLAAGAAGLAGGPAGPVAGRRGRAGPGLAGGPLPLGCGGRPCPGALLLALRAPLAKLAARPLPWAGVLIASALSAWLTQSTALAGLAMFTLGLVSGNLLSLERSPTPALPAALLTLAGDWSWQGSCSWCPRSPAALC